VKVTPESVLSNRGNLEGTHMTRFSPGGGDYIRGLYLRAAAFSVAAARVWDELPRRIKSALFLPVFLCRLTTHRLNQSFPDFRY